jgi:hypothetical protein
MRSTFFCIRLEAGTRMAWLFKLQHLGQGLGTSSPKRVASTSSICPSVPPT